MTGASPPTLPLSGSDILLIVAAVAAILMTIGLALPDDPAGGALPALLAIQAAVMLGVVHVVAVVRRGVSWHGLGVRPTSPRWCLAAIAIALATIPVVSAVNLSVAALQEGQFRNPQIEVLAGAGADWMSRAALLASAAVAVPIAEEVVFRGILYGWLRSRIGVGAAIAASALIFGAAHGIPMILPALAVQGAVLALVYERSGSLWPPILLHATFNGAMMAGLFWIIDSGLAPYEEP